jgi:YD repeat-containing protein
VLLLPVANASEKINLQNFPLTFTRLGPVEIGMSDKQLRESGFKITELPSGRDECLEVDLNVSEKVMVMFEDSKITRISLYGPAIKTDKKIGVGSSEHQVKAAYKNRLFVKDHQYDENGRYLTVITRDGKHAMVYETDGKRVTNVHAGLEESAQYVEGCL